MPANIMDGFTKSDMHSINKTSMFKLGHIFHHKWFLTAGNSIFLAVGLEVSKCIVQLLLQGQSTRITKPALLAQQPPGLNIGGSGLIWFGESSSMIESLCKH